jgi:hypothetical protein
VPHGPFARSAAPKAESIEEVWFRRAHCDITGGGSGSLLARAAEALPAAGERPRLSLPRRKTE